MSIREGCNHEHKQEANSACSHGEAAGDDHVHEHDDHEHKHDHPPDQMDPAALAQPTEPGSTAQSKSHSGHSHGAKGHGHHHADARKLSRKRIFTVLLLSGTFMIVEAITGIITGSLALIADAGHMLGDVAALALAFFAIWLTSQPAGPSRTYGFHRSEILAALANSVLLVLISIYVLFEAIQRFSHPPEIHSTAMLIVASLGLCVNLISMQLLTDSTDNSLNARAAYLEVVSDMLASIGVILAAAIMMTTGWYIADPIISSVLSLFILWRTWGLMKESIDILMENAPEHVDLNELSKSILGVNGVLAVHDMHVWTITSGLIAMSGHVTVAKGADPEQVLDSLNELLEHDFSITHTTIQLEGESKEQKCNDICAGLFK